MDRFGGARVVLFWIMPIGFAVFTVPVALHLAERGELPRLFGIPLLGGGFFERFGVGVFVALLMGFAVVCALEVLAGVLLWNGQRSGGILALILLPVAGVFWLGFALPLPPLNAAVRTALVVLNWSSLQP